MSSIISYRLAIGLGIAALAGIGALFWKNKLDQAKIQPLTKQQIIRILKLLRRQKYIVYKQIATLAINIAGQMRGNINAQMIEQFVNGPQSPVKFKESIDKITDQICKSNNTTSQALVTGLELFKNDEDVKQLLQQEYRDYQTSLSGRLPAFNVNVPATFTKQRFVEVQNKITKKTYLNQVVIFKKLSQYSEEEIQQNPQLLSDVNSHQNQLEDVLIGEGLGTQFEPPFAVYEAANLNYRKDAQVRAQVAKIEQGYQRILMRYSAKLQNKSITEREFKQMQEQVQAFQIPGI